MILDDIVKDKKQELAAAKKQRPLSEMEKQAARQPQPYDLAAALSGGPVKLIAEIKKASPSKGLITADFDPIRTAGIYAGNGASAISVLTEVKYFQGNLAYLDMVKTALHDRKIPVLRKDFLFEPYQIIESRAHQADAVLLIAAILPQTLLKELLDLTHGLRMKALVEVHNREEMETALRCQAGIIGINNRDLKTFKVDITNTKKLCRLIPEGKTVVSESGILNRYDMEQLRKWGVNAVLIGEALMTATNVAAKMRELL
jgi:indole-3-glycerol phosphate synthase